MVFCYRRDVSRYRMALILARFLLAQVPGFLVFATHIKRPVREGCADVRQRRPLANTICRPALSAGAVGQPLGPSILQTVNARPAWRVIP